MSEQARFLDGDASRYECLLHIGSGGMAAVYVGRRRGAAGFSRLVAIKQPHAKLASDPRSRRAIVEEARLASKAHHPNIVAVHDVEESDGGLVLVLDYVEGASLGDLLRAAAARGSPLAPRIGMRILLEACAGLQAAHTLVDELGRAVQLIHRDVSPQNILVGVDGTSRITDFGIAKSAQPGRSATSPGVLKGKAAYMAPEYIREEAIDARADVFALGVVAWEIFANRRLFRGATEEETIRNVLSLVPAPMAQVYPEGVTPALGAALDEVLAIALAKSPHARFSTARAFGGALETVGRDHDLIATTEEVAHAVRELCGITLSERREQLRGLLEGTSLSSLRSGQGDASEAKTVSLAPTSNNDTSSAMALADSSLSTALKVHAPRRSGWIYLAMAGTAGVIALGAMALRSEPEIEDATPLQASVPTTSTATATPAKPTVHSVTSSAPPRTAPSGSARTVSPKERVAPRSRDEFGDNPY